MKFIPVIATTFLIVLLLASHVNAQVLGTGRVSNFRVISYSDSPWLNVAPSSGVTDALLTVRAVPDNLPAGSYIGLVSVDIPGVPNSAQSIPVLFTINPQQ